MRKAKNRLGPQHIPVFVWRSSEHEIVRQPHGRCIFCRSALRVGSTAIGELNQRTLQELDDIQTKDYGRLLRDFSDSDYAAIQPEQARHWEAWDLPSPTTLAQEEELFSEFYYAKRGLCSRCGWWAEGIASNHGAGFSFTASAALKSFDLRGGQLSIPEICSHLSKTFSDIYAISPRQFEEVIASVYRSMGWRVTLTKQSRDGGVDLYCINNATGVVCIVECKRYRKSRKVGIGFVDRLIGVSFRNKARVAHLVTQVHLPIRQTTRGPWRFAKALSWSC